MSRTNETQHLETGMKLAPQVRLSAREAWITWMRLCDLGAFLPGEVELRDKLAPLARAYANQEVE